MELHLNGVVSDLLKSEIERIYAIENCKEFIENLERDALHRLDDYDQSLNRH